MQEIIVAFGFGVMVGVMLFCAVEGTGLYLITMDIWKWAKKKWEARTWLRR